MLTGVFFAGDGVERERERNIDMRQKHPTQAQPGTETTIQAHVLTGNRTKDLIFCGVIPNQATQVRAVYLSCQLRKFTATTGSYALSLNFHEWGVALFKGGRDVMGCWVLVGLTQFREETHHGYEDFSPLAVCDLFFHEEEHQTFWFIQWGHYR